MMYMMHFSQTGQNPASEASSEAKNDAAPEAQNFAASDKNDATSAPQNYATSHYAICTAFMALSMMLPGFVAGKIELAVGYNAFFWIAIICSLTTVLVTYLVRRQLPCQKR